MIKKGVNQFLHLVIGRLVIDCSQLMFLISCNASLYQHLLLSHFYRRAIHLLIYSFVLTSKTVKFGHVTFFWNGNQSGNFNPELEEYVEIPSDAGIPFNARPKMKAVEIAEKARDAILSRKFDQVIQSTFFMDIEKIAGSDPFDHMHKQVRANLPNGDMVGHTGDIQATIVGCKAADEAVKVWSLQICYSFCATPRWWT